MILHKYKTVFIHIPKCGGTSIVNRYSREHGITEYKFASQTWSQGFATACIRGYRGASKDYMYVTNLHATYDQYALQYGNDWKFVAQVRHPYTRFRSAWSHLSDLVLVKTPFKDWVPRAIESMREGKWHNCIDDMDALYELHIMKPSFDPSIVMKPQWTFVRLPEVEIHKLENMTLHKEIGLEGWEDDKWNVSKNKFQPTHEWTDANRELIYDYYKRDFEDFYYGA